MNYEIKQEDKRTVAGFHLVGPWEQTVKKGFEQLMMWVDSKNIVPKEWVAVYYDNPDETPAEKLRCDTVVTVPNNFTLPENSEGVILTEISGGQYARLKWTINKIRNSKIGDMKIQDITKDDIQEFLNSIKNLSDSYIKKIYEQFVQAYRRAEIKKYIMEKYNE